VNFTAYGGTLTFTVPTYKGTTSPTSCHYSNNACYFTYTPKGRGTNTRKDTITATYSDDPYVETGKATTTIEVKPTPPLPVADVAVSCFATSTTPGVPVTCTSYVNGFAYGGTLTFTVPTYKGTTSPTSCHYSNNACYFTYTPKGRGTNTRKDTITATYSDDPYVETGKATTTIEVKPTP
jgi:hypothetical protein